MKYKSVTDMVFKLSGWKFRVRWIISRIVKWFRKESKPAEVKWPENISIPDIYRGDTEHIYVAGFKHAFDLCKQAVEEAKWNGKNV